jgi:hypothetical protein
LRAIRSFHACASAVWSAAPGMSGLEARARVMSDGSHTGLRPPG